MAVEKMEMIDIVGHMDEVDEVAKKIILSSSVHMASAITEIQQNNFPILKAQENVDAVLDYSYIRQYASQKNLGEVQSKVNGLLDIFELKNRVNPDHFLQDYNFSTDRKRIDDLYRIVKEKHEKLKELNTELKDIDELQGYLSYMKHIDADLGELMKMKYISMKLGKVSKYSMDKLKKNYENVSAIVFKLYQDEDEVVILLFVPLSVELEVERVLASLNFEEYRFKANYKGTPYEWIDNLSIRKAEINSEIDSIRQELATMKIEHTDEIEKYNSRLSMEYKIEELKSYIVCTNEFFYLTGWVPAYKKNELLNSLAMYEDNLIIIFKGTKGAREGLEPPTCLKNHYIVKPFESVVKLYGIPSYNEVDPTGFLGLSYMLLFGAMFGDVGQGMVLFIIGEVLNKRNHRPNLGGVIARLGMSSVIFGFLYGSLFGYEEILPAIVVKPMDKINLVLIAAVVFGAILLSISFVFNLINAYKSKDIENGIFSRNGLVGLCFYWLLLYVIIAAVTGTKTFIPGGILTLTLVLFLGLMLFKEPISNLIKGVRPLYHESKSDYFIEGGFGVVETLLSMFSNTVSFIRVGAFAINHVGLFIAFDTLAKMMTNGVESAMMIILGNVIIIGLEGLIVFIQGLRLEYYELFSKYFSGVGYEYNPIVLRMYKSKLSRFKTKLSSKQNIPVNMN